MTEQNVQKVHACIVAVADALRSQGIGKEKKVTGGGNYKYRGIDDVYAALAPLLASNHLYIAPIAMDKEPEAMAMGGKMRLIRLKITYRVTCAIDGSYVDVVALGDGMDTGDKASGKAMSYAYKSLMFQLFCIPVEGQPDTDTDSSPAEPVAYVTEDLLASARCAADGGTSVYKAFFAGITAAQRKALVGSGLHDQLKNDAANADAEEASINN